MRRGALVQGAIGAWLLVLDLAGVGHAEPSPLMQSIQRRLGNSSANPAFRPPPAGRASPRAEIVGRFERIACAPYVSPVEVQGLLRQLPGGAAAGDRHRVTAMDGTTTTFTIKRTGYYPDGSPRGYVRSTVLDERTGFLRTQQYSTGGASVRVATRRPGSGRYAPLVQAVLGRKRSRSREPGPSDPVEVGAFTTHEHVGRARRVRHVLRDVNGRISNNTITTAVNGDRERYQLHSTPEHGQRELWTLLKKGTGERTWLRKEHDLRSGTLTITGQAPGRTRFERTLTPEQTSRLLGRMSRRAGAGEEIEGVEGAGGWRYAFQNLGDGLPGFWGNVVATGKGETLLGLSARLYSALGTRHGTIELGKRGLLAGARRGELRRVTRAGGARESGRSRAAQAQHRARGASSPEITTRHHRKIDRALDLVLGKRPEGCLLPVSIDEGAPSDAAVRLDPINGPRLIFSPRAAATFSLAGLASIVAHEADHMKHEADYRAPRLTRPTRQRFYGELLGRKSQQRIGSLLTSNELRRLEARADRSAARFAAKRGIPLETCVKHLPPDPPGVPLPLDDHPRREQRRRSMTRVWKQARGPR